MAHRFIGDMGPGERLEDEVFLIRSKDLRTTTQGSLYIHTVLTDRTGQIPARMWQATQGMYEKMPIGGFMRFKGRTENYKGSLQFIIDGIGLTEPGSYEVSDFLASTKADVGQMFERLTEILGGIKHPELAALVQAFLDDEDLMSRLRRAPAAAVMHHAYVGGLLEHTVQLLEVALRVMPLYPKLSTDLVVAGIFLHDIGKTHELTYESSIGYSEEGQLLGHIVQAVLWIEKRADEVAEKTGKPFPERVRWLLQHLVLSHHGQYEFGSPKLPAVPEAAVIHYLDNLDAKTNMMMRLIEDDRDPNSTWTQYSHALQTKVYKPDVLGVRSE